MENNSNLYTDIANALLNNFNDLIGLHQYDSLINMIIALVGFLFIMLAASNILKLCDNNSKITSKMIFFIFIGVIGIIICCGSYSYLDNQRIIAIQEQTIKLQRDLSVVAEKHNMDKQIIYNIAQDVILCETDNLNIQSNLNFSFECKDKQYAMYKESFPTTFDNIQKLNNAMNNQKLLIFKSNISRLNKIQNLQKTFMFVGKKF